jgi:hypothetical protein
MASRNRLDIRKSLWICGVTDVNNQRHAAYNVRVLQAGGTRIFMFKGGKDPAELKALRELLWRKDDHVILSSWLKPYELAEIYPLLRDRRNFSLAVDDWWQSPYWFTREADYLLFRKYHGIAVRQGQWDFVSGARPPLLLNPFSRQTSRYLLLCSLLRPAALAASPFLEIRNWWRRRQETVTPDRCIYLPFGIDGADVPLQSEQVLYDFGNTSGTFGFWVMRSPYAPAYYTFANLYADRGRFVDAIASFENNPFTFYDCRREKNYYVPWDLYLQKTRQSRFVICSGGLQDAALPKYLEYACLGVPMIGRAAPFEHPWQEDVVFEVDMMGVTRQQLKPLLQEALGRYPAMREKCLNLRDRLLKQYDFNAILDMAQAQADGQPIPPAYIRPPAAKNEANGLTPATPARH